MKLCGENSNLVKIGKFTLRPNYVSLLPAILNGHKALSSNEMVIRLLD
jgi:hypothetical protein